MTEKELINQIKGLKQIEPDKKWLDLTRYQLLGRMDWDEKQEKPKEQPGFWAWLKFPQIQFDALVVCLLVIFIGGPWLMIMAAEASLPGEWLYSLKRAGEQVKEAVATEQNKSQMQVNFAQRRLEELDKIAQKDEKTQQGADQVKEMMADLKDNLASASVYADKVSPESALALAKTTKQIKENLDRVKQETSLAGTTNEVSEAEKSIGQISASILAVLNKDKGTQKEELSATSTDQEIITFLEEASVATSTNINKDDSKEASSTDTDF